MTTSDPADAVQVGIRAVLLGDAQLQVLIGERVYDEPPEDLPFPYVHIGEVTQIPDGTHDRPGRQVAATIHTWAKARSARPVNQIGARIVALLDNGETAVDAATTGHTVWMVKHEFSQTLRDPDRSIRHRIDRVRVYTSQD